MQNDIRKLHFEASLAPLSESSAPPPVGRILAPPLLCIKTEMTPETKCWGRSKQSIVPKESEASKLLWTTSSDCLKASYRSAATLLSTFQNSSADGGAQGNFWGLQPPKLPASAIPALRTLKFAVLKFQTAKDPSLTYAFSIDCPACEETYQLVYFTSVQWTRLDVAVSLLA